MSTATNNKIYLILLFLLTFLSTVYGQGNIKGTVTSANKEPVPQALVYIKEINASYYTDDKGNYLLANVPQGNYTIECRFVGYIMQNKQISVAKGKTSVIHFELIEDARILQEVVVQASGKQKMLRESPEAVTVIDGAEIRGRATNLESVLSKAVGITIRQTGGLGSDSRLVIHGLEGKRVQMYVNGSPLDSPDGSFTISDIPIDLIERIEIYKGIIPAKFGGDGLGGAVNIVSSEFDADYVDASYQYGSFNTHKGMFMGKKNFDKQGMYIELAGNINHSDNDYSFHSPYQEGLTVKRDHDKYTSYSLGGEMAFSKLWFDKAKVEFVYYKNKKQIQGIQQNIQHASSESDMFIIESGLEKYDFILPNLSMKYDLAIPIVHAHLTDTSSYRYDFEGNKYASPNGKGELNWYPHLSKDKQIEVRQELNFDYNFTTNHNLNLHSSFRYSKKDPDDPLADEYAGFKTSGYPSRMLSVITGLTWEARFLDRKLENNLGIKHYFLKNKIVSNNAMEITGNTPPGKENTISLWGVNEGIRYKLFEAFSIKLAGQYAMRLPSADELFGDGVTISTASKMNLEPEKSINFNLGTLYDKNNILGLTRIQFEGNVFWMNIRDMIKLVPGTSSSAYSNLGKIEIKGFDAELKVDITPQWYVYGNISYQDARDKMKHAAGSQAPNPTKGLRVPNLPILFSNFGCEFHMENIFGKNQYTKIYWDSHYTGKYYYNWEVSNKQSYSIPKSFTHDCGIQHSFSKNRYTFSAEVNNLTDREVTNVYRMPLPGRTFQVKFRYTFINHL